MKTAVLTLFILIFSISVAGYVFSEADDTAEVSLQKGKGLITKCSYRAGQRACGACYCLKAGKGSTIVFNRRKLRGCARLDISEVGILDAFVDKVVYYEGTSDFDSTFICPQHFKLFTIRIAEEETE